jgi:hypothetical protein
MVLNLFRLSAKKDGKRRDRCPLAHVVRELSDPFPSTPD